ncbi:DUF885 domain-containing protein [Janthinobacterium fluminis]|uniref:DUF885 domain-containing protein n=1 Tax=Janthinobacterium fluminis TaxID=2987524 RepID=A0ABT5JTS9_9BURK|nr:DUF885 domain-containing protein [Janthinobacterium fluminis]MDC8756157.1 DUF885 domain-containing protein [Janthinobacterium fluminis]
MKLSPRAGAAALLLSLLMGLAHAGGDIAPDLDGRRKALASLIQEQWEYNLRNNPELASIIGDKRYNDRLTDFSQSAIDADLRANAAFLARFEAIDSSGFPAQEQINKDLMLRTLRQNVAGARFKEWEMPVLQNSGIHLDMPQLVSSLAFDTVKDYEDYVARLRQLPRAFDDTVVQMRKGMRDGLMPPQFLIPAIARQSAGIAAMKPAASPFAEPLKQFPASFSAADKARLRAAVLGAIARDVAPSYRKFSAFVRTTYLPHGRKDVGLWSLPDGAARYSFRAKASTTTEQTPEQIHQLGLAEVQRIEGQMLGVATRLGFADLKSFNASLDKNPAVHPKSGQEMLDLYGKYTEQMYQKLPQQFGILPKGKVKIAAVEAFREKEAAAASYNQGTPDGSRPGRVMVNTGDFAKRMTISIETTALHEGVPGHHMQIAIAQELDGLPPFRQQSHYTAYVEGWALYAERLGEELGFYKDPYSYYGHLQDEMLRAIRLVVDTGLHYKKWNRQQVVDYFHDHSGIEEVDVQSETDRYIVWPGQALGYKIGQLKILELRAYAKAELGEKFDIRDFHDQVLGAGALPMDLLEARIKGWVAAQKSA